MKVSIFSTERERERDWGLYIFNYDPFDLPMHTNIETQPCPMRLLSYTICIDHILYNMRLQVCE